MFIKDDKIALRGAEPEDALQIYTWENDRSLWRVSNTAVPYTQFQIEQFLLNNNDLFSNGQLRLMIMRRKDNCTLGTVDITDFVPLHSRGAVGIAVHSNYRQEGYASDALKLLCEYAFNFLFIKQLYAHIAVDNEPSLRLFNSCGFTQCGVLKEWLLTHEGYKDAVLVQCMNPKR